MERRTLLKYLGLAATAQFRSIPTVACATDLPPSATVPAQSFFFNQLGYLPNAAKVATLRGGDAEDFRFRIRNRSDDQIVYEARLTPFREDAASGDLVRQADFSPVQHPGSYAVETSSFRSDTFPIHRHVYADALGLSMRAFYGQRCGCAVDLGNGYQHPACHHDGAFHPSSGKSGPFANHGGWHDAGDYGRYVVNSGITCGTLLWAWELYPEAVRKLDLSLPGATAKSQHKLPDFLSEIQWNIDWMLSLQGDDGGVFHKQTSEKFCAFILPQNDHLTSEVIGTGIEPYKSTCATADFAAVMAIAARCYAEFDPILAARFLTAARRAWTWATAHPTVVFKNPPGISTGEYGDSNCADELLWASAELWRTTGEPLYERAFLGGLPRDYAAVTLHPPSWGNLTSMACWTYAVADRAGDDALKTAIRSATRKSAAILIERSHENGYGNTMAHTDYIWGSNSVAANQSLLLALAHHFEPNAEDHMDAALNNLHYLLGRNCHGVSWVTQLGTNPFLHPHHRPSVADDIAKPWPGLLSGGPNHGRGDPIAQALPDLPPMRMWLDDERAYSLNEVAINWNAPLVFLLAFATQNI